MSSINRLLSSPHSYWALFLLMCLSYFLVGEVLILFAAYFLIGFPHGAMDIVKIKNSKSTTLIFTSYLALGLLFAFFLMKYSLVSLYFLFLTSCLHFMHVEWMLIKRREVGYIDLAFGSLFLLPIIHNEEFKNALMNLDAGSFNEFFIGGQTVLVTVYFALALLMLYINRGKRLEYLFVVSSFWVVSTVTSLYFSFSVFFIAIHSLRHLQLPFKRRGFQLSSSSVGFLLAATTVFSAPILLFPDRLYIVFIVLGALSLPHLVLELQRPK